MESFAELLGHYVQLSGYSARQIAGQAEISYRTLANWLGGVVLKPQQWQGILKVAAVLNLDEAETSQLLLATGHSSLIELRKLASHDDRDLLLPWQQLKNVPFQAIADLPYFVGRKQALREVGDVLLRGQNVAICNLHGMGGVGKTSLATHLAYQVRPFFPDGVLWARLDTSDTLSILRAFAKAYGEDVSSYRDLASCASAVRSILADKHVLIVLDNAESSEQVRPLLPPTTGKISVLITTRHDLAVVDEMYRFPVETFDPESGESLLLFTSFLGDNTVQEWREVLHQIADLLGHLPLAVAIAAGRLANGRISIPYFLNHLQRAEQRLDALVREDRSVRLSFDLSYQALSPEYQQFFAALGAFGGDDFSVNAIAHVTHTKPAKAQKMLDQLYRLSLIQMPVPRRYQLHPLLRDFAREQIVSVNTYEDMVNYYIELAQSIQGEDYEPLIPETSNILAGLKAAVEHKLSHCLLQGVKAISLYFHAQGLLEWQAYFLEQAKQQAYSIEDIETLIDILYEYGKLEAERGFSDNAESYFLEALALLENVENDKKTVNLHQKCDILVGLGVLASRYDLSKAQEYYLDSLKIARRINDTKAQVRIFLNLGANAYSIGNYDKTIAYHLEGLPLARQIDSPHWTIMYLVNLCELAWTQGDYELAETYLDEAETLAREKGHYMHLIGILGNRSVLADKKGDDIGSERFLMEAVEVSRKTGHLRSLASMLGGVGNKACRRGDYMTAQNCLNEAIDIARKLQLRSLLCQTLNYLGNFYLALENWSDATKMWIETLEVSQESYFTDYSISAYYGLARVAEAQGNKEISKQYTRNWQEIYAKMNDFNKKKLEQWLPDLLI